MKIVGVGVGDIIVKNDDIWIKFIRRQINDKLWEQMYVTFYKCCINKRLPQRIRVYYMTINTHYLFHIKLKKKFTRNSVARTKHSGYNK